MKLSLCFFISIFLFSASFVFTQQPTNTVSEETIQNISTDLSKISKSVDEFKQTDEKVFRNLFI